MIKLRHTAMNWRQTVKFMNNIFTPPSTVTRCETGLVSICLFRISKWNYHYFQTQPFAFRNTLFLKQL